MHKSIRGADCALSGKAPPPRRFAGLLAKCNRGEPIEITLGSGKPLGKGAVNLKSGAYYEMRITADGSAELAVTGAP